MTRQKKEIIKKMDEIYQMGYIDSYGFGYYVDGLEGYEDELNALKQNLADLRHYASVEDMYHDDRETQAWMNRG